jgi:hypothetical protein
LQQECYIDNLAHAHGHAHSSTHTIHSAVHNTYKSGNNNLVASHLRNVPKPPPMPSKVNIKKSAGKVVNSKTSSSHPSEVYKVNDPAAPIPHDSHKLEKNNFTPPPPNSSTFNLPTLDEINKHHTNQANQGTQAHQVHTDNKIKSPLNTPSITLPPIQAPQTDHKNNLPTLAEINNHQSNPAVSTQAPLSPSAKRIEEALLSQAQRPKHVYKSSSSSSGSKGGFFQNTSKKNTSTAWKALSGFILGFILFFVSIQLICWNERRAVKFTNFIDWTEKDENVKYIGKENLLNEKVENTMAYIVNGTLNVTREAQVDCPDFEQISNQIRSSSTGSKLLFIKFCFEKWGVISQEVTDTVRVDENGNEEDEIKYELDWIKINENSADKTSTRLYLGEADLNGIYKFELRRISLCENDTYTPKQSDNLIIQNWMINKLNNPLIKVIVRGDYFYIISNENSEISNSFDLETYDFKESDRRLSIKYLQVCEDKPRELTLAGKFEREGSTNMLTHSAFDSPIKHAQWNYYLCCCGETDEAYQVDIVMSGNLNKKDIIENYELENKTCTCLLRIFGFIMHFGAYYLILYPLILLIGMIPFIGAVGATILIIFAFLFATITYLFIIAVAWVFARPLLALLMFAIIGLLIYTSKMSRDKYGGHYPEQNGGYGYNWGGNSVNNFGNDQFNPIPNPQSPIPNLIRI